MARNVLKFHHSGRRDILAKVSQYPFFITFVSFLPQGAALHSLKRYNDAVNAYEAGLKVSPSDAGLTQGLAEVKKAMEQPKPSGLVSPALLNKLASHPKFGPKLADPAFQAKLNMLNTNPQAMLQVICSFRC